MHGGLVADRRCAWSRESLATDRRSISQDGRLKLCSMKENVREVFRMLNIEKTVFDIHDSASEALAIFSAPASDST